MGSPLYKINTSASEMPAHSESVIPKEIPAPVVKTAAPQALPVMVPVPVMGESITQVRTCLFLIQYAVHKRELT